MWYDLNTWVVRLRVPRIVFPLLDTPESLAAGSPQVALSGVFFLE
jgi:hypothetical protein